MPTVDQSIPVPAEGGSVSGGGATIAIADGTFGTEAVTVHTGQPIGQVDGEFAAEIFGAPVGITHTSAAQRPVTVSWTVGGLSDEQRQTLMLVHWDESQGVWLPSDIQPVLSGDTLTAELSEFSFWDWVAGVGQTTGTWTGARENGPTCKGSLPSWIKGTVSPSENLSAAAVQVCFEPDKNQVATVRVTNNRPFTQAMTLDGTPKWTWTWPGPEDYGVAGAVYTVGHLVLDSDTSYLLAPLHEQAVGIDRPSTDASVFITGTATVSKGSVLVDATAFLMDQADIGGTSNPVLNAFLQVLYECAGGKTLLADATSLDINQTVTAVVDTLTGCGAELSSHDSEAGKRFEQLSRQMIASSNMGSDAATMANRAVRRLASYAKILTFGKLLFYINDQLANAMVGPLTWSIRGSGKAPTLGNWTPSCSDVKKDANALYRNIALQDEFADKNKDLWEFPGWDAAATRGVVPLKACTTDYRTKLAAYLPSSWGDPKAAKIVADKIAGPLAYSNDPRVSTVTPFLPDGRVGLPLESNTGSGVDSSSCFQSDVTQSAVVYQCGTVADYLPACWPSGNSLYCLRNPSDPAVVRVPGGGALPVPSTLTTSRPWQIQLADGTACSVRLGGAWDKPPDGFGYTYSCNGNYVALLTPDNAGTVNQTAASWTVTAQLDWSGPLETVEVAKVIYAGVAPTPPAVQTGASCPAAVDLQAALDGDQILAPETGGGIRCVADWATSIFRYEGEDSANSGLFQKVDGQWRNVSQENVCPLPSPIPAALYGFCEAG